MVTWFSFASFFIVGLMWGVSDAFMEVGSKSNEILADGITDPNDPDKNKKGNGSIELGTLNRDKKKKEKMRKETNIGRKIIKKMSRG